MSREAGEPGASMQHSNAAHCLADELLGLLQRLQDQLPRAADERALAVVEGAKGVIDPVIEVIDRRLPVGPACTCTTREDTP